MIVEVKKPFLESKVHKRALSPGDVVDLPEKYVEHLKKLGAVADPKDKNAKVTIQAPKPPQDDADVAKSEEDAPENKAAKSAGKGK